MTTEHRRQYIADYNLKRYHQRMNDAFEMLGGECVVCGSKEDLQLDHLNPDDKSFTIGKLWSVSQERFIDEVLKCQLLCGTCHLAKTLTFDKKIIMRKQNHSPRTIKKAPRKRAGLLRQDY